MLSFLRFSRLFTLPVLFLSLGLSAHAVGPKGDVFVGYSRLGANAFYPNVSGLNGLEASASLKVKPFISIEGDLSHYGYGAADTTPKTTMFMVGPRVTVGALRFKVFAHALVGGQHSSNSGGGVSIDDGALTYAAGGGADIPVAPFFAWRVMGDYIGGIGIHTQDATKGRFSTGLVFRF